MQGRVTAGLSCLPADQAVAMRCQRSDPLAFDPLNFLHRHREQRREFIDLHHMVDAKAVGWAGQNFRRGEGKGEVAGGREAAGETVM